MVGNWNELRGRLAGETRKCQGGERLQPNYDRIIDELKRPTPLSVPVLRGCLRVLCADVQRTLRDASQAKLGGYESGQRRDSPRYRRRSPG